MTALQVISTFGLQSFILWETDSAENPAKTTFKNLNCSTSIYSSFICNADSKHQKSSKNTEVIYYTEWTAPIRAHASIAIGNSINMGK